jgi:hypothetical protein
MGGSMNNKGIIVTEEMIEAGKEAFNPHNHSSINIPNMLYDVYRTMEIQSRFDAQLLGVMSVAEDIKAHKITTLYSGVVADAAEIIKELQARLKDKNK